MLKSIVAAFLIAASFGGPAAAKAQFYACETDAKIANGWISPSIGFVFDGKGGVQVIDSVILHFLGKPLAARVKGRGDKLRITWTIPAAYDSQGQRIPSFGFIATLDQKTKALSMIAKPARFPQRFSGKGTCQIRKDAKGFLKR